MHQRPRFSTALRNSAPPLRLLPAAEMALVCGSVGCALALLQPLPLCRLRQVCVATTPVSCSAKITQREDYVIAEPTADETWGRKPCIGEASSLPPVQ